MFSFGFYFLQNIYFPLKSSLLLKMPSDVPGLYRLCWIIASKSWLNLFYQLRIIGNLFKTFKSLKNFLKTLKTIETLPIIKIESSRTLKHSWSKIFWLCLIILCPQWLDWANKCSYIMLRENIDFTIYIFWWESSSTVY